MRAVLCLLLYGLSIALAFNSKTQNPRRHGLRVSERHALRVPNSRSRKRRTCDPCQTIEDENNPLNIILDRREAAFAMLGAIWASTTTPYAAHAATGDEARLAFPDPLQGLNDRNSKQCLVESLGNRECLVYMADQESLLYKGADYQLLIKRIESMYGVLKDQLPKLIETKKWTQVTGVLTGPLGELVRTMNQVQKLVGTEKTAACEKQVQVVKKDLYAISAAIERKDVRKAMAAYEATVKDLAAFIVDYAK
ncbi:hypothetical protein MPSEU_001058500 [Mayamaea pseudoterrestris]|nr:hypothetical protein MPSEU_001058500 [Mayamaea pseudoterrestris]